MTTLLPTPDLGVNTLTPRPYQTEAIDAARECLRKHRSTLIVMPTGTGKTTVFALAARMCAEKGGRTLVLSHRDELVKQAANTLDRVGLTVGVEQASSRARATCEPHVVSATVQTLKGARLESWPRDYFRLLVVDEAHHSTAQSYQTVLSHFARAKVIGVTATPDRADEDEIADVYESTAYEMTLWDALTAPAPGPYLSPLKFVRCEQPIDLSGLKASCRDYTDDEIAAAITPLVDVLANAIKARVGGRQTMVFTPDCASASAMATALQSIGCKADYVWGDSPDRETKIARYKDGETRIIVNCAMFTEGFDAPYTSAVVLCRPTKSRALYSQMIGRGTRLAPGKDDCLVVDFAWLTARHDLCRPADLVISRERRDESDAADVLDKLTDRDESIDLIAATEQARNEGSQRRALRIKAKEREDRLKWRTVDPLAGAFDLLGLKPATKLYQAVHDRPTSRQIDALRNFGVPNPESLSRRNATAMMDRLVDRIRAGKSSLKQINTLVRNGVPVELARDLSRSEASTKIDEIAVKQGWRRRAVAEERFLLTGGAR